MTWLEEETRKAYRRGYMRGYRAGFKEGLKVGAREGQICSIAKVWARRFGPMPEPVRACIEAMVSISKLEAVLDAIDAASDREDAVRQIEGLLSRGRPRARRSPGAPAVLA